MRSSSRKSIAAALLAVLMLVLLPVSTAFAGTDLRSAGAGADMAGVGTISPEDVDLLHVTDDVAEVIAAIQATDTAREAGDNGGGMRAVHLDTRPSDA